MNVDLINHMEEAWSLDGNPFPAEAIHAQDQPYSPDVFYEESREFRRKLIRGSVVGSVNIGFLWSQGSQADTGFGKTTLMREITKEINRDLGIGTLKSAGVRHEKQKPIAAAFSNLNNLNASGLYPVLFNAVIDLARSSEGADAVLDQAKARIVEFLGTSDPAKITSHLRGTWLRICGTGAPLRKELVDAFASGGAMQVLEVLNAVSHHARLRNGLHYLDFGIGVLASAGIDHLYLMIDQLEDLATTRSITSAKRSREIGRIRDMLETDPYVNRVHFIFTFHNRAAQVLERYWEENRLPPFEISPSNTASVVVLRGFRDDRQVRDLLRVYLEGKRNKPISDDLMPFDPEAISVLKRISEGRVGILLNRARELLNFAADRGDPRITGELAQQFFEGGVDAIGTQELGTVESDGVEDIDDLLLGTR